MDATTTIRTGLRVTELAAAAVGVAANTIHIFEKTGVLARTLAGYRAYEASTVERLPRVGQLMWMTSRFSPGRTTSLSRRPARRRSCVGGQDLGIFSTERGRRHECWIGRLDVRGGRPRIMLSNRLALATGDPAARRRFVCVAAWQMSP